jgi:hypothetical protein
MAPSSKVSRRWRGRAGPTASAVPRCNGHEHGLVYGRRLKRYQCRTCGHQATLTAGTIMQSTKLPLTTLFLAFYLIGQALVEGFRAAVDSISSLELSRQLAVNYDTTLLLHKKTMRAMVDREQAYLLRGMIQIDDAYLGRECPGDKAGCRWENKIPIIAVISSNEADCPIHARITPMTGFSSETIGDWARKHLAQGSSVLFAGLACLRE